ncbi:hypothetical protein HHUSO_G14877 [Huso huso]|uniref:Uncharacterized protein n=1 Tax=Huso huso TaxID=61971 RepID=A0ABR0ZF64_HUSHU
MSGRVGDVSPKQAEALAQSLWHSQTADLSHFEGGLTFSHSAGVSVSKTNLCLCLESPKCLVRSVPSSLLCSAIMFV